MTDTPNLDRLAEIFARAVELSGAERDTYLDEACGSDSAVRAEIDSMLEAHRQQGDFLAQPSQGAVTIGAATTIAPVSEGPGDVIGRYRLLQQVGEGGFGLVYMAEQERPVRRQVALKIIKLGMDTKQVIARFEAERQALALMDHPNVAKVLDAGATDTGRPYFVMEYVPGDPITDYCDRNRLRNRDRLVLFIQACEAVQHAHQKGIIHRDIKPSNVLVAAREGKPIVKVIDFGVAKATAAKLTEQTIWTEHGQLIGTPEYMSPEQAEMRQIDIDTRSDIYSLGVLLYQLLTGELPFDPRELRVAGFAEIQRIIRDQTPPRPSTKLSSLGDATTDIADKHQSDPRTLVRDLRGDLDWIVMKCLEKDRVRRYETASGLAMDVQRHLDDEPVIAGPPSVSYRLSKFVRRHRAAVAGVAAVFVVLILGVAGTSWGLIEALQARADEQEQRILAQDRLVEANDARDELEQVAEFQAWQLSDIDVELMAMRLHRTVLDEAAAAWERSRVDEAEATERTAQLEMLLAGTNFTDVSLALLDENVMERALRAIDEEFADQPLVRARLQETLAETLRDLGLLDRATAPLAEALEGYRNALGDAHPHTLRSIHGMGVLLDIQGKLDEAEPYYREALEGRRRVLGDDHPDTLTTIGKMGGLLQDQGKLDEAEPYIRETLEARRRVLGDEHPHTLRSINAMGFLLQAQGKLDEAERYYRETLEARRRILGDEHPETLITMNNMGHLLQLQGKLDEAERYYRETLEVRRRALGDEHVVTLTSIGNMANVLHAQGKLAEAEPLFREALESRRRLLGNDHPSTLNSINSMGYLLKSQGKPAEAERLYREALEGNRRILGDDHPDTLTAANNLGSLLQSRGRLDEAEPYLRETLEARRRVLGDDHPDTLISINNMGYLLTVQGKLDEAESYLREALERRRRVLGDDHPNTMNSLNNVGYVLNAQGKLDEAEPCYREALAGNRRALGDEHPNTLRSIRKMGVILCAQGRYVEAEPFLREFLEAAAPGRGADRWRVGEMRSLLGEVLAAQRRYDEAEPLLLDGHAVLDESLPARGRAQKLAQAIDRLVDLYDAWDKPEQAAEWRARRKALLGDDR